MVNKNMSDQPDYQKIESPIPQEIELLNNSRIYRLLELVKKAAPNNLEDVLAVVILTFSSLPYESLASQSPVLMGTISAIRIGAMQLFYGKYAEHKHKKLLGTELEKAISDLIDHKLSQKDPMVEKELVDNIISLLRNKEIFEKITGIRNELQRTSDSNTAIILSHFKWLASIVLNSQTYTKEERKVNSGFFESKRVTPWFVDRSSELKSICDFITSPTSLSKSNIFIVHGKKGIGKSELANKVTHEENIRGYFTDGMIHLDFENRNLDQQDIEAWIKDIILNYAPKHIGNLDNMGSQNLYAKFRNTIRDKKILFIFDNLYTSEMSEITESLFTEERSCVFLVTTKRSFVTKFTTEKDAQLQLGGIGDTESILDLLKRVKGDDLQHHDYTSVIEFIENRVNTEPLVLIQFIKTYLNDYDSIEGEELSTIFELPGKKKLNLRNILETNYNGLQSEEKFALKIFSSFKYEVHNEETVYKILGEFFFINIPFEQRRLKLAFMIQPLVSSGILIRNDRRISLHPMWKAFIKNHNDLDDNFLVVDIQARELKFFSES